MELTGALLIGLVVGVLVILLLKAKPQHQRMFKIQV